MKSRAFALVAVSLLGSAVLAPMGCVVARVEQSVRDPDFHGTIGRLLIVGVNLSARESALPAVMQEEFAGRRLPCLALAVSSPAQIDARQAEIDAFAPDAWMHIVPADRLVDVAGNLEEIHYQVNVRLTSRDGRWVWRADVANGGGSTEERLKLMAVRIADYMTSERLIEKM